MTKFKSFATSVRTHTQHAPRGTPEHVWISHHKSKGTPRTQPRLFIACYFVVVVVVVFLPLTLTVMCGPREYPYPHYGENIWKVQRGWGGGQ